MICIHKFDGHLSDFCKISCSLNFLAVTLKDNALLVLDLTFKLSIDSSPRFITIPEHIVSIQIRSLDYIFLATKHIARILNSALEAKITLPFDGSLSCTHWQDSKSESSILYIGTDTGELLVYNVSISNSRCKLQGSSFLSSEILDIKSAPFSMLVATSDCISLFQSGSFTPLLQFGVPFDSSSSILILHKTIVCTIGSKIKFWNTAIGRKKSGKPPRKAKLSHDKVIANEVSEIVKENEISYRKKLERHANTIKANGKDHGMSQNELEEYAMYLSLQEMNEKQAKNNESIKNDLTDEEMFQLALLISKENA
jgi:hypothetical protein